MRKQVLLSIFAFATFAAFIAITDAQIKASITVKDYKGNTINGKTVPIGTTAYVYGHYEDQRGNSPASGQMDVFYDGGSGYTYKATIWSGNLNDGGTATGAYTMSELGSYEFRMTCQIGTPQTLGILRCEERVQARTTIQLATPEPGTLAGLAMALAAFALTAVKRTRTKQ